MNTDEKGLALLCDLQGMIVQVFRNDLSIAEATPGHLFLRLMYQASYLKALNFINEIKTHITAFNWELYIQIGDDIPVSMHFSGGKIKDQLLIVGAADGSISLRIYDDMLLINNEQTNLLCAAPKENSQSVMKTREANEYDEMSRLNNELVAMQRELAAKNAELSRLNSLKNQFLGMAAHDLRIPLQEIVHYSSLLLDDPEKLETEQTEYLTVIRNQSNYMTSLVNDLLDVSTIESGNLQFDLQPVDLGQLAQTNLNRNQVFANRKNITLDLKADSIPVALLDPVKMEQVLDNLITNAIKYSPPGSRVHIRLQTSNVGILLSVHDEGQGIPPPEKEKLFNTSAKSTGGEISDGLRLAIVKRIVFWHRGRIWVESEVGVGSTIYVEIPIST